MLSLSMNSAKHHYHDERNPPVAEERSLRVTWLEMFWSFAL